MGAQDIVEHLCEDVSQGAYWSMLDSLDGDRIHMLKQRINDDAAVLSKAQLDGLLIICTWMDPPAPHCAQYLLSLGADLSIIDANKLSRLGLSKDDLRGAAKALLKRS